MLALIAVADDGTSQSNGAGSAQVATSLVERRERLERELREEAEEDAARMTGNESTGNSSGFFSRMVIGFYRNFISPAIGSRCALEPSCSHYFMEATEKHGWLGVPMTADRFVREPVASASDAWVQNAAGQFRHPDPVEDHDYWMK